MTLVQRSFIYIHKLVRYQFWEERCVIFSIIFPTRLPTFEKRKKTIRFSPLLDLIQWPNSIEFAFKNLYKSFAEKLRTTLNGISPLLELKERKKKKELYMYNIQS